MSFVNGVNGNLPITEDKKALGIKNHAGPSFCGAIHQVIPAIDSVPFLNPEQIVVRSVGREWPRSVTLFHLIVFRSWSFCC